MGKEKGRKRGKKKMEERQEEREKEGGELEERTEERIEDTEEGLEVTEEACKEDERCEEESECHSVAKRARVCATFTDSQENAIVEFGAPRAVRQGAWTFPRQTEEGGSLGRNLCRTEAPAL